jgi:protein-disulfide isomerase
VRYKTDVPSASTDKPPPHSDLPPSGAASNARRQLYRIGALLVSVLATAAVVVAVLTSGSTSQLAPGKPVPGAGQTLALFADIPQHGIELGNPSATVTLVEFGDLQCPICAEFAENALPRIVARYVRPGRVRLLFRNLHLIGNDSLRAARMAGAVGEQNHLWEFIDLMYRNQGAENSSYVTDRYLQALASAIPGVDVSLALRARDSAVVQAQIDQASRQAAQRHIRGTPSFLLSRSGEPAHVFTPADLSSASFSEALEHALAGSGGR